MESSDPKVSSVEEPPDPDVLEAMAATNKDDLSSVPPEVVFLFERLAMELVDNGFVRYSARAILHRIRWHYHVEKGDKEFKCNNNWTPQLSRWFMVKYPQLDGFFAIRASPGFHSMEDYEGPYEGKSA